MFQHGRSIMVVGDSAHQGCSALSMAANRSACVFIRVSRMRSMRE